MVYKAKSMEEGSSERKKVFFKDKVLVETSYDITAVDNRIFYCIMYNAQMRKNKEVHCVMDKKDFYEVIGKKENRKIDFIMESLDRLMDVNYKFWNDVIVGNYKLIAGWEFNKETERFEILMPSPIYEKVMSYDVYAPLNLSILTSLKSFYSQRLYDLFRLWSRTDEEKVAQFTVEYIRFILGLKENAYKEFKHLNQCVKNAVKDINAKTNMQITYTTIRTGRKVSKFKFTLLDREQRIYFSGKVKAEKEKCVLPEGVKLAKVVISEFKEDFEGYDFENEDFTYALKDAFNKSKEALGCKTIGTKQYGYFRQVLEEDICKYEKYGLIKRNIK